MQRILITGGTGFIGSALARSFAQDGFHVIVTGTHASSQTKGDSTTHVQWDGLSVDRILPYVDGAFAIIHLAGEPIFGRWTQAKRDRILRSRVESGSALCAAIRKVSKKPKMLVQASASGFYGDTKDATVDESGALGTGFLSFVCAHWESSTESIERLGVRRCIIRTTPVIGAGGVLAQRAKPFKWFVGGPVGSGSQWVSGISLSDEVAAIRFLVMTSSCKGIYNLAAPNACTERDFATSIGAAMHRPSWIPVPVALLKLLYGDVATELAASQRIIPKRLLAAGFTYADSTVTDAVQHALSKQ